ncbi:MAG: cytidylate kinase family protein [Spirochaetes bacterium]|nr:cytidylate kinase family protein [Spirochaetota bacterium]
MPPVTLSTYISSREIRPLVHKVASGHFITVSRQYGCYGYSLGVRLVEALAGEDLGGPWAVYNREILERLASHTRRDVELLKQKRLEAGSAILEFMRGIVGEQVPSGPEVRRRITLILQNLAREGRSILIGQGSTAATADLPGGLSLRFEAPESWRIEQVCRMMNLGYEAAKEQMAKVDQERRALREIYGDSTVQGPAFDLTFDCSAFSLEDVVAVLLLTMRRRGWMEPKPESIELAT